MDDKGADGKTDRQKDRQRVEMRLHGGKGRKGGRAVAWCVVGARRLSTASQGRKDDKGRGQGRGKKQGHEMRREGGREEGREGWKGKKRWIGLQVGSVDDGGRSGLKVRVRKGFLGADAGCWIKDEHSLDEIEEEGIDVLGEELLKRGGGINRGHDVVKLFRVFQMTKAFVPRLGVWNAEAISDLFD